MKPKTLSRREFLRLSALTAVGTALVACTPKATEEPTEAVEPTSPPEAEQPEPSPVPTEPPPAAEPVKIVIWDPIYTEQQVLLNELLPKYTEMNPNVTFEYESIQYDEVHKKTTIAMAGGGGPDAFNIPSYTWARFIDTKTALPVDPKGFGVDTLDQLAERYVPNLLNVFSVNGVLSVIPTYVGSYLLMYNPIYFPDGFPKTWDQLLEMSKTINQFEGDQQTRTTIRMGVDNPEHVQADMCPFIWEKGGDILNADRTKCTINEPAAVEGIAQMRKLVDEKAWIPNYPFTEGELYNGQLAIGVGGDWGFGYMDGLAAEKNAEKVQLGPWPVFKEGDQTHNYMQPWGWLVNAYSKNPDETWKVLGYLMSEENAERWQFETYQYTGVQAPWVEEMYVTDPRLKLSHEQLSFSHLGLISVKFDELMQPLVDASQAIMYQNEPIQETLDAAAAKVDEILAS